MKIVGEQLLDTEAIGKKIREHRLAMGMTQRELAEVAMCSQSTITNTELNKCPALSLEILLRICRALDMSFNDVCIFKRRDNIESI